MFPALMKSHLLTLVVTALLGACHGAPSNDPVLVSRAALLSAALYPAMPVNGTNAAQTGALNLEEGVPLVRGFYFESRQPGTLLLSRIGLQWGGCSRDEVQIQTAFKAYSEIGELTALYILEPNRPIRFSFATRGVVEVSVLSRRQCQGLALDLVAKFYEQDLLQVWRGGTTSGSTSGGEGEGGPTVNPEEVVHEQPPPPPEVPVPVLQCPRLVSGVGNGVPTGYQAGMDFVGMRSKREGCSRTFSWQTFENVRRSPSENCQFHPVVASVAGAVDIPLLKWQETQPEISRPLFWINGVNQAIARDMMATLNQGKRLVFTRDEGCLVGNPEARLIDSDADVLVFAGDPRLNGVEEYGYPLSLELDRSQAAPLLVQYRYEQASPDKFLLKLSYQFGSLGSLPPLDGASVKANFFHRRTRSYVGEWTAVDAGDLLKGSLQWTDQVALRRLLPRLGEVELVLRSDGVGGKPGVLGAFSLFSAFNDPAGGPSFQDLSHPGRNRFLLKEEDLP